MKTVLLIAGLTLATYLAARVAMRLPGPARSASDAARLRRSAWLVVSALAIVLAVLAARALGLVTVPLVAALFLAGAVAAPWLVAIARAAARRSADRRSPERVAAHGIAAGPARLAARHEIVVLTLLALGVSVVAVFVASIAAPR